MPQSTLDQTNNQQPSSELIEAPRSADPQVCRVGIRADKSAPEAASPQPPQQTQTASRPVLVPVLTQFAGLQRPERGIYFGNGDGSAARVSPNPQQAP